MLHARIKSLLIGSLVLLVSASFGQTGHTRFREEVETLVNPRPKNGKDITLFTGSSSIRLWSGLEASFPNYNVLNYGFGGSSMSDLLYYCDDLILRVRPERIFIYEGDNDLASGVTSDAILATGDSLIQRIRRNISTTVPIYFISPKPSIARWGLKEQYLKFNDKLKHWTQSKINVQFIDGWSSLVDQDGNVMTDIFLSDNLHLNEKGYSLWSKAIKAHLP